MIGITEYIVFYLLWAGEILEIPAIWLAAGDGF